MEWRSRTWQLALSNGIRNSISSSSLPMLNSSPRWEFRNKLNFEGRFFLLLIMFQRSERGIWIQNRKTLGPPGACWTYSLTNSCASLMRKQIQKWTVMIFKELPLHEKRRWHTFSSLSFTTLPQTPHPLAKLFTNPSTDIELFLAFTQAIHLPHHWFSSKSLSTMWHLRNILDKNLMQGLACLIHHWVLRTKHSSLYLGVRLKITTDYRNASFIQAPGSKTLFCLYNL